MKELGIFVTRMTILALAIIWNAFIFTKLWVWFYMPVFEAPQVGMAEAIGITALLHYIWAKPSKSDPDKSDFRLVFDHVIFVLVLGLLTLGIGWVAHFYI